LKALPEEFAVGALNGLLADAWGFEVATAAYVPVGVGSYHWVVGDLAGARGFVTVDDLDRKPWLGDTRESAFDGLRRAFDTALALRKHGLHFVVAPIPTNNGETVCRFGPRHTVALFPFVDGEAGRSGRYETPHERAGVATLLAELHNATPAVDSVPRKADVDLPGRRHLEAALRDVNEPWLAGPFSEPARQALAAHASDVAAMLARADGLAADVAKRSTNSVVTHGEPHARNVMRTDGKQVLVDWDTVGLAPPERDLWMLMTDTSSEEAVIYADATGHQVDEAAVTFFRLTWDLKDIVEYLNVLRAPHEDNEDTAWDYEGLTRTIAGGGALTGEPDP
jgi:spectinomycin phosphotransferase